MYTTTHNVAIKHDLAEASYVNMLKCFCANTNGQYSNNCDLER